MNRPVRVLYISGGSLDDGGISAVMLNYAKHIDPEKMRIDFIVHGFSEGSRENEAKALGATVYHVPYQKPRLLSNRRAIRSVIQRGGYDVVHAHMDGMNGYVLKLAKQCGVPRRISHCHNTQFLTTNPLRVLLHRLTAGSIPRYATDLFACSESAARFLYGDARIDAGGAVTVRNAIELEKYRFSLEERRRIRGELGLNGRFVIGCIGRYDYQKNQAFLLDAFQRASDERPELTLLLVGDGADRQMLEARVDALGLRGRVLLLGYRQDVPALLSALDLFVMPSRFEGLGIALIEAQANGLPCLASDQVPRDTNVLCCEYLPITNVSPWAERMRSMQPSAARDVPMAAFEAAGYDIRTEAAKLEAFYLGALKPRVLFLSNIPAPYRIDFYNELGRSVDLTVLFEARRAAGVRFNWNEEEAQFRAMFLSDGDIDETHVDRRILPYIQRGAYDRIVATNYGYFTETAALAKMRILRIPYDLELDGGVLRPGEHPLKRFVKRWLICGAQRLFSTGAVTDALFIHYGARKTRIVRYPFTSLHACDLLAAVPTDAQKRAARDELAMRETRIVLYVGQLIHRKGVDVLLNACEHLPDNTGVYIVGGEPMPIHCAMVRDRKLSNVHFFPFMEKQALMKYFLAADVFALPTREDVWGLVVNEAMANALPVVTTTACTAGMELIRSGENGALVPPEDAAALGSAIRQILEDDRLRAAMAGRALETARDYTIERMAEVHLAIFAEEAND